MPDRHRVLGLVALAFYFLHAAYFVYHLRPSNLFWGCHMAALGVGTGLLLKKPSFNAMGVIALTWGVPMWLFEVARGGEFLPTSMGTHIGGLALGLLGVYWLGLPRYTWVKVSAFTLGLLVLCRLITLEKENVNLAFGPPPGFEESFPPYPWFGAIVLTACTATFVPAELIWRRVFGLSPRGGGIPVPRDASRSVDV